MRGVSTPYWPRTTCSLPIEGTGREHSSAPFPLPSIGSLQMAQDNYHVPVLEREIVELFTGLPAGVVVDATLGGGGHAGAILAASPTVRLLGIDRDPEARAVATTRLAAFAPRVRIVDAAFADLDRVVHEQAEFVGTEPVVGVLMDLGVSSHQLDESSRGFSFRVDAPLDMRMDTTGGETAAEYLARVDEAELTRLLRENGEGRFARSIARSILTARPSTTQGLSEAVEHAVPAAARRRGHVATRVFQALRIAVNDESRQLDEGLRAALDILTVGGVIAVISYHSGEDRVVKAALHEAETGGCRCPVALGCVCGAIHRYKVVKASAILAGAQEIAANPRARSARLRAAHRVLP